MSTTKFEAGLVAMLFACASANAHSEEAATDREDVPAKTSTGTDISDLWWDPTESGWGMQLVQEHSTVFATLFIYGTNRNPTWVTAQLLQGAGGVFSGPVYVTTGPYFGGSFDPATVTIRPAGTMTFVLTDVRAGQLTYSIDGVTVSKQVQRQTLATDNYNGNYIVAFNITVANCNNPAFNGTGNGVLGATVSQTPSTMSMVLTFPDNSVCTYTGSYAQNGKMGMLTAPYSCNTGEVGTFQFFEMTNRVGMLSGRMQGASTNIGCSYTGRFTGLNPSVP